MNRETAAAALRARRAELGLSLDEASRETLLRKSVLESLEAGGPDVLNGFFKSYARRYAEYLGLDGDEVVSGFSGVESEHPTTQSNDAGVSPKSRRSSESVPVYHRKRSIVSLVVIVVVALVVATVLLAGRRPSVPAGPSDGASTPSVSEPGSPSVGSPSQGDGTAIPGSPSAPTEPTEPSTNEVLTLELAATTRRAWVEITADGRVVFSGVLSPGSSTRVSGRYIVVDFGNAMYTNVTIDGVDKGVASPDKTVITLEYGSPNEP
jgi:cytoskeletal protein RodZ